MYWLQHTYISSKARLDWAVHVYILRPQPPTQTIQSQTPTQILTVQTLNLFTHKQSLFPVPAYNFAQWIWCPSLKFTQIFKTYSLSNNYPNRDSSIQRYQSIITQKPQQQKKWSVYTTTTLDNYLNRMFSLAKVLKHSYSQSHTHIPLILPTIWVFTLLFWISGSGQVRCCNQ